jgi:hypothetical protein
VADQPMSEVAPGIWDHSIPTPPFGWRFRRRVFKECRRNGGHFFHSDGKTWSYRCCRCGFDDENPFMPKGHLCAG